MYREDAESALCFLYNAMAAKAGDSGLMRLSCVVCFDE